MKCKCGREVESHHLVIYCSKCSKVVADCNCEKFEEGADEYVKCQTCGAECHMDDEFCSQCEEPLTVPRD